MTGPPDPAAASGGQLRAGHADREQVIDTLKTAFVHGRLTKDELELRVGQVLASRTYTDLAAVTADLPTGPATVRSGQRVLRPVPVIKAATALYAVVWVYAAFFPKGAGTAGPDVFVDLTFGGGFFYLIIVATCLGHLIASRRAQRSAGVMRLTGPNDSGLIYQRAHERGVPGQASP